MIRGPFRNQTILLVEEVLFLAIDIRPSRCAPTMVRAGPPHADCLFINGGSEIKPIMCAMNHLGIIDNALSLKIVTITVTIYYCKFNQPLSY